jgi:hypothetical protein
MTREELKRPVVCADTNNHITNPAHYSLAYSAAPSHGYVGDAALVKRQGIDIRVKAYEYLKSGCRTELVTFIEVYQLSTSIGGVRVQRA